MKLPSFVDLLRFYSSSLNIKKQKKTLLLDQHRWTTNTSKLHTFILPCRCTDTRSHHSGSKAKQLCLSNFGPLIVFIRLQFGDTKPVQQTLQTVIYTKQTNYQIKSGNNDPCSNLPSAYASLSLIAAFDLWNSNSVKVLLMFLAFLTAMVLRWLIVCEVWAQCWTVWAWTELGGLIMLEVIIAAQRSAEVHSSSCDTHTEKNTRLDDMQLLRACVCLCVYSTFISGSEVLLW